MRIVICLQIQYFEQIENYFSQTLNVHGVNDITQIQMHTPQPLVPLMPKPSSIEREIATEKLKTYKSPDIDQIHA
jgi:hypothetical protein